VQNVLRQKEIERKKSKKSKERRRDQKIRKIQRTKLVGREISSFFQCKEQKKTNHRGVSRRDLQSLSAAIVCNLIMMTNKTATTNDKSTISYRTMLRTAAKSPTSSIAIPSLLLDAYGCLFVMLTINNTIRIRLVSAAFGRTPQAEPQQQANSSDDNNNNADFFVVLVATAVMNDSQEPAYLDSLVATSVPPLTFTSSNHNLSK
jgi:hypothetical protein